MRIVLQSLFLFLGIVLIAGGIITIVELNNAISSPSYNPRDGQAGFVYAGVFLGKFINLVIGAVLLILNVSLCSKREQNNYVLYVITNISIISGALLLMLYSMIAL